MDPLRTVRFESVRDSFMGRVSVKTIKKIIWIIGFFVVAAPVAFGSEDPIPVLWTHDVDCVSQTATLRLKRLENVRTSWEVLLLEDGVVQSMLGTHAFLSLDHDPIKGTEFPLWGGFPEFARATLTILQNEDFGSVFATLESPLGIQNFVCKLWSTRP